MTIQSNLCNHALEGDVLIVDLVLPFPKLPVCACTEPNTPIQELEKIGVGKSTNQRKEARTFGVAEIGVLADLAPGHGWG
jgi:hypothetical protein